MKAYRVECIYYDDEDATTEVELVGIDEKNIDEDWDLYAEIWRILGKFMICPDEIGFTEEVELEGE